MSDDKFIEETIKLDQFKGDSTVASHHMISLGFTYLYRGDLKTAMYRFNQAYLLDSLNTDIYWGYGAVYMALGNYIEAKNQYEEGLSINPKNTHLITDLGTSYMAQYFLILSLPDHGIIPNPEQQAENHIDTALAYLNKSYFLDPKDQILRSNYQHLIITRVIVTMHGNFATNVKHLEDNLLPRHTQKT